MTLGRKFYNQNTIEVAKGLLGCFLVREHKGKVKKAMITEVEAYRGEYDLACHASKGKTKRTEVMYGRAGHAYIYMIYGMYFMLNIVTEEKEFPAAVLIRGLRAEDLNLNGPGKLTKFLNIDRSLNGHDLTIGEKLWIERPETRKKHRIKRSPRVGIDYAKHCRRWKWNFRIE